MGKTNGQNVSLDAGTDYPDLEPDGLGELKSIQRAVVMPSRSKVPQIKWGEVFESWPVDRQLRYLKEFGSSMNHAARLVVDERDAASQECSRLEKQIKAHVVAYDKQGQFMHTEIAKAGEREQEALRELVKAKAETKEQARRVRVLEAERGALD